MHTKAIKHIAANIKTLRIRQAAIEAKYMSFDCSFTDADKEREYCELGAIAQDLELFCCRDFESAEYLQACLNSRIAAARTDSGFEENKHHCRLFSDNVPGTDVNGRLLSVSDDPNPAGIE